MAKQTISMLNVIGVCFLLGIDSARATDLLAAMHSKTRDKDGNVRREVDITSGIFRGEAKSVGAETNEETITYNSGIGAPKEDTTNNVDSMAGTRPSDLSPHGTCDEDTEFLLDSYEDIRLELWAVDQQYLENASIENACVRDGQNSNCNFDFRRYPSNLETVCNNHGGNFFRTEHSIQCHNPSTMERLYYQFDHYPSCCSELCEMTDANRLLTERIDSITELMSEYLDMTCFADSDILRHANDSTLLLGVSGSAQRPWQLLPILLTTLPFLLL